MTRKLTLFIVCAFEIALIIAAAITAAVARTVFYYKSSNVVYVEVRRPATQQSPQNFRIIVDEPFVEFDCGKSKCNVRMDPLNMAHREYQSEEYWEASINDTSATLDASGQFTYVEKIGAEMIVAITAMCSQDLN